MPVYEYTARNPSNGQIMKGQLDVPSKDDVVKHLKQQKMMMVNIREQPKKITFSLKRKGVATRDIVIFTRQFATMINAGLPLVQSLDILAKQTENPALAEVTGSPKYFLRVIERDPYDEQAHLGLVNALEDGGGHGEARRAYSTYVARMQEIGTEPASFPAGALSGA